MSQPEKDRPVTIGEMAAYARRGCRQCRGNGVLAVKPTPQAQAEDRVCGCAVSRFDRVAFGRVVEIDGERYWRLDTVSDDGRYPKIYFDEIDGKLYVRPDPKKAANQ